MLTSYMFKNNILNLLKSTSIVALISAIGSLAAYLININYIATFIFLFIIQFIIFSFVGNILTSYFTEKTKQKQLDLELYMG